MRNRNCNYRRQRRNLRNAYKRGRQHERSKGYNPGLVRILWSVFW